MAKAVLTEPHQFFLSGPTQIDAKANLHRISLMARDLTLGPSVAPCPVESSTVHGATFFRVMLKSENLGLFLPIPISRDNQTTKKTSFPATINKTPIIDPSSRSRRPVASNCTCKRKLGFYLVGLFFNFGPSPKVWPITKTCGPTSQFAKPRSVLSITKLSPNSSLFRFLSLCGRRLHRRWKSNPMLWSYYYHQRTLVLLARLLSDLKHCTTTNPCLWSCLQRLTQPFPFKENSFPPSSYMERTLSSYMERTLSSYMERTLATSYNLWLLVFEPRKQPIFHTILLLCVEILVPARFKVLESSSTSLCQSTVTNISPPEVLVEVSSTQQEFACANMLFSYRQVLVDLKSYYLIYLCIVLLNVLLFHVLNIGSLNPLYPCIVV